MNTSKHQFRRDLIARRAAMSPQSIAQAGEEIAQRLMRLERVLAARSVFVFASVRHEPDTRPLITQLLSINKQVSVPRLDDTGRMHAHRITRLDDLAPGGPDQYHIPVPASDAPIEPQPDLAVVPGLAFTRTGLRLGMGGGYYDRYLAEHPTTFTVGIGYHWQLLPDLPHEPHDQPVQAVVTDRETILC